MSQTLEERVAELERKVVELTLQLSAPRKKDWRRTVEAFKDCPEYESAMRLGREYREQQTYEKEIADSPQ